MKPTSHLRGANLAVVSVMFVAIAVCLGLEPAKAQDSTEANARLQRGKVATLYEKVTDNVPGRSLANTIRILRETHTDLVFRGFWAEWFPTPDSPENIAPELRDFIAERGKLDPAQVPAVIRREGFYYDRLRDHIAAIKREMPNVIFIGSFPAQRITRVARNPITGKILSADETWRIALGPEKWKLQREGKPITKEEFQRWLAKTGWTTDQPRDDPRKFEAYFPDITNPEFQELLLSWAKKQIDCGADGVWIDGLEAQPFFLDMITDDPAHPAVKESLAACAKVVDAIHRYGQTKGKHVYVASWARPHAAYLFRNRAGNWDDAFTHIERWSVPPPQLDFVTLGPLNEEVLAQKLDQPKWDRQMVSVHKLYGDTPVFAFLDWAFNESQTVYFSQKLSKDEQRQLLKTLDAAYAKMGVNFIYPVHGGYMGSGPITTKLAFGTQRSYDSLAPEFDTYETIRELARKKAEGGKIKGGE